ncbi:MAG TPA: DUF3303 family protein [Vicinamibacterales bacterium]|nr:DUF3303 family protein [Vicinamibacterales bacterium]
MLFMVIEHFRNADAQPVQERFIRRGRMLPEGVTYHASWIERERARCFQLMEADGAAALEPWISAWSDIVDFEVVPVLTSADFWTAAASSFTGARASRDEQDLRDLEQGLARAWLQRDRAFLDLVLAPEWTVTQADGTILSRSTVLGEFFDAVRFDTNVIDDVAVTLFGDTAVVRGRTSVGATFNGVPVSARIRFTDVFIKRKQQWQVVASHASSLATR